MGGGARSAGLACTVAALALAAGVPAFAFEPAADDEGPVSTRATSALDLHGLSIDQLVGVSVTSASSRQEPISQAPASIVVITHERIVRSGAQTLPEMLRLAPNLQVYQVSSSNYVITARGLNGNSQAQSYSNKLLVLIDGRTVYTPLFSGVYWDMQQVAPDDIDRIEVISGPGATLWGANAVNGVINIITRRSSETQGALVDVTRGNFQTTALAQVGGALGPDVQFRAYASNVWFGDTRQTNGQSADDRWTKPQGGFRLDWTASPHDLLTLEGDIYGGKEGRAGPDESNIAGDNLNSRWTHTGADGSVLQVQTFFDRLSRGQPGGNGAFSQNTYDVDVQDALAEIGRNRLVVGGGFRAVAYDIRSTGSLIFEPYSRTLNLGDAFVQDTFGLRPNLDLIAGLKLEDDPYVGVSALPNLRLSWRATPNATLWAAISRAIRSPTPFDEDVIEKLGGVTFLTGSPSFRPEGLTAYEAGGRFHPAEGFTLNVSTYYDVYDHLRSIEVDPLTSNALPLHWGNLIRGDVYGVEAWAGYDLKSWWRIGATVNALHDDLSFAPGSSRLLGVAQEGDDPPFQATLRSMITIGQSITWDANLRRVDALPNPALPGYTELNSSIGWRFADRFRVSLSGFNLLHAYHQEYVGGNQIPRSVFAEIRASY